ncbi:lysine N(6)-hydroxylase/L-ornithine N(5)-oxygenase family protein [Halobacillus litoralis]|uniref:lysine N(6)-hydroxylase/L-ornithine N(5)-oxygenase family protein n=1 Tax=Halobacillus litoralis TaxID=45668 RepID=UPI001CFD84FB|nr:lysine N(6)-hydroxylase/L-ornithine N(5)-oxygenase family protein [Halobacillus litoralis]WLR47352.1 lysine N(6)-hydroxylase/L-ornithine N(5)-oxygenase family protein [Halobacillus litoralis]
MNTEKQIFDVIGIGLGPFNLGMAALLDTVDDVGALFLEREEEFQWHPHLLMEGTTLQVPFFADLVSMADVTNKNSFLNYLQEHNRLYNFYFLEKFHIPRKEYNHYCRWVSDRLDSLRFGKEVTRVTTVEIGEKTRYQVKSLDSKSGEESTYIAKNIVMGIGTEPRVPEALHDALGASVFHTSEYLKRKPSCDLSRSVAVIGSGQSAAEVFLDVAKHQEETGGSLQWYTRSQGFFPMEYSKLGLEYFSPDYIDFFYELPQWKKDQLLHKQDLLYKGISAETIAAIYDHLYERTVGNTDPSIQLQAMTEVTAIQPEGDHLKLRGYQKVTEDPLEMEADLVILGTGYQPRVPAFFSKLKDSITWDDQGRFTVNKGYDLATDLKADGHIFIQNGELHTHGVGAPDLGLGAHRNAVIINRIAGREVYSIQQNNVFQTFGTKKALAAHHQS